MLLTLALIFWAMAMAAAVFGFAIISGGTAVIAQTFFWFFFLMFAVTFIVAWGYLGMMPGDEEAA